MADSTEVQVDFPEDKVLSIVDSHKADMIRLLDVIKSAGSDLDIRQIPLAFPADNPIEVTVFPNIILDLDSSLDARSCLHPASLRTAKKKVFTSLREMYKADMADVRKARKWEKIDSLLGKKENTTMARFLRNHLKLSEKGLKDDRIRDIATKIEHFFKPPELNFCESPKDYVTMFNFDTNTCMSPGSRHFKGTDGDFTQKILKAGRYPSEWYHYVRQVKGVFLSKQGRTVARAFLVRENINQPFKYASNVVGCTPQFAEKLCELLRQAGYQVSHYMSVPLKDTFEIPLEELDGQLWSPYPFHDIINYGSLYVGWNKKNGTIKFGPINETPKDIVCLVDPYSYRYRGFLRPKNFEGPGNVYNGPKLNIGAGH